MANEYRDSGPVPARWERCPRQSEGFIMDLFVAFKTPLDNSFRDKLPVKYYFQPQMVFQNAKIHNKKLGLWIDLTNTRRFYDRKIVQDQGAEYVKLQCRGHGETPSREQTQTFIDIVDNFTMQNPLALVGVHCTHGFNRTGFLIVCYLVEKQDYAVDAALSVFAQHRPPGIYKQDYIDELYARYEGDEEPLCAPQLPDWCYEEEVESGISPQQSSSKRSYRDALENASTSQNSQMFQYYGSDGNAVANGNGHERNRENGSKPKRKRSELIVKNPKFMEGVPDVNVLSEQPLLSTLQGKIQQMCGWKSAGFPGSQPVSMDMENIKLLREEPYRVSWKADGARYMMLIDGRDAIYFFDRNNSCFKVDNIAFLSRDLSQHLTNTLLDGEMVIDKLPDGQARPRYLIYDVITLNGKNVGEKPFYPNRIGYIHKEVVEPRLKAFHEGVLNREAEPFGVRLKEFWDILDTKKLLSREFERSLLHKPDGLIYQPAKMPYAAGACPKVLKWKPLDMNSVDFLLRIEDDKSYGSAGEKVGYLFVGGLKDSYSRIKYTKELRGLNGKIIECTYKNHQWVFMRERTDKLMPNSYSTAQSVMESIQKPVTAEYLLLFIQRYGRREDSKRMPPPMTIPPLQRQQCRPEHQKNLQQLPKNCFPMQNSANKPRNIVAPLPQQPIHVQQNEQFADQIVLAERQSLQPDQLYRPDTQESESDDAQETESDDAQETHASEEETVVDNFENLQQTLTSSEDEFSD